MTTVLLVSQDTSIGSRIADEFDSRGDTVMWCRGPQAPDYVCAAGRSGRCALTLDADLVVVDGWLASDQHDEGMSSRHLVGYYRNLGLPVLALVGHRALSSGTDDAAVVTIARSAEARTVVEAAASLSANRHRFPTAVAEPKRRTRSANTIGGTR